MTNYPDWVSQVSDADLNRRFGASTVARGRQYATRGRVGAIQCAGPLATATVRGSGYRSYHTSVTCSDGIDSLVATCSCPMRRDCKHAVALILELRSPEQRRPARSWQSVLAPFEITADAAHERPLALQISEEGPSLVLRPLQHGVRSTWIRAGAGWDEIARSTTFQSAHRAALLALLETRNPARQPARRSDGLALGDLLPAGWQALRAAVGAGVELIAGTSASGRDLPPPLLAERPVSPSVLVAEDQAGDVELRPAVTWQGNPQQVPGRAFLGRPPHGVWFLADDQLVLAPLSHPLDEAEQALFQHGNVTIPSSEIELFSARFLPLLRRHLSVALSPGVELPEPQPPRLLCRVDFAERSAHLRWGFRYTVGERTYDVGLAPDGERALRSGPAEERLAGLVPDGPWASASQGRTELRPTFLTGRPLIRFVTEVLPTLEELDEVDVELSSAPPQFQRAEEEPSVHLAVTDSPIGDWFDLHLHVAVGEEQVPLAQLLAALTAGDDHLILDSGTWFPLDAPELAQLRTLIDEASVIVEREGDTFRLRPEHAGLWAELVELGIVDEQSAAWRGAVGALLDPQSAPAVPTPAGLQAELRPYQETGFEWLAFLLHTGLGGILADEMGLGKTLQALALAQSAKERGELTSPLLVVAPTSVIGTWASEAARFTPNLATVAITSTQAKRGTPLSEAVAGADVVITSYTLLRLEAEQYRQLGWTAVLLDEAQFVKNPASKAYQAVRKLRAQVKVALTGTPLENNLMDLWSLLSITAPGLFPDPKAFTTAYRRPIEGGDAEALARLHRRIRPLILRRTKAAVAAELPDKQEQVVPVELSPGHRRIYERHLARERQKVLGLVGELNRNRITILRSLTLLRQLSLSPALIDESYPASSAKIDTLAELIDEVIAQGHRALVFSQFTGFLSLVKDRLTADGVAFEYLDGRTRDRAGAISEFREGDAPVFLISLKAGGFGLTLTEADYVFILDPWWNPAAENQAIDRTHRIGQDKRVNVYRLVAADTIEEKVVELQLRKRNLFDAVVGTGSDTAAPLSADDILGLLED